MEQKPNKEFHYGFYCVAFLDLLGQRRKLRQLSRVPKKDDETTALLAATAGNVLRLRGRLETCFEHFSKPTGLLESLPKEVQQRIENAKQVKYRGFSDSIIMEISLRGDDDQFAPMTRIFAALGSCCILLGAALATKCPIRGGIEVGLGMDISDDGDSEVYGPVLETAHYLESEVADYPRIVVGNELLAYLGALENSTPTAPLGKAAKSLAGKAKRYIVTDSDGLCMLDFLGQEISNGLAADARGSLFKEIAAYITEQLEFAYSEHDGKHLGRYMRLASYVENRASLWVPVADADTHSAEPPRSTTPVR
jgi:hypothetical protein